MPVRIIRKLQKGFLIIFIFYSIFWNNAIQIFPDYNCSCLMVVKEMLYNVSARLIPPLQSRI